MPVSTYVLSRECDADTGEIVKKIHPTFPDPERPGRLVVVVGRWKAVRMKALDEVLGSIKAFKISMN